MRERLSDLQNIDSCAYFSLHDIYVSSNVINEIATFIAKNIIKNWDAQREQLIILGGGRSGFLKNKLFELN